MGILIKIKIYKKEERRNVEEGGQLNFAYVLS